MQLLPLGGTTRLPPLAALGWIIACFVEFGKIRGCGLPRRGFAPPRNDRRTGDGLPRRGFAPSRNDGTGD